MSVDRRRILAAALSVPLAFPALRRPRAAESKTLRVGFQKGEPVLMAAKAHKTLEAALGPKGYTVEWIEFQFGPPMLEAMRVGSIDFGAVGDTPPVFAQAARGDLLYAGALRGAPQSLLLPAGSKIEALADLKGRKIAFGRGSSAHHFTLLVLEKAGLRYDQIQPTYLGPADAGAAFERGAVDAWSIWQPYTSLFDNRPGVRTLITNKEVAEQFGFLMGNGPFVRANPDVTARVVEVLAQTARTAQGHHEYIAAVLATATGIAQDVWTRALAKHPFEVLRMDDALTQSQQKVADRFRALGLVPIDIKVSDIVWRASA
ncbi:MAG: aliphatic sulfonate ABC transporter substrate-binding protein [Rhodopila sp.]